MAILNLSPDSFSDGCAALDKAMDHAAQLVRDGAHIIDVGGESTRPGSEPVPADLEIERVVPVITRLVTEFDLPISVDTQKPEVAAAAVAAGASIVNHVSASLDFEKMVPVLAPNRVGYVAMHMKARPKSMQREATYADAVDEVGTALVVVRDRLNEAGIEAERCLYDPGIGFGKKLDHNLELMRAADRLVARLGRPLLMGISRKSWMNHLLGADMSKDAQAVLVRDALTAVASTLMPYPAAAVHRVHHPALCRDAFVLRDRLLGQEWSGYAPRS